jgi:hypothetical protein
VNGRPERAQTNVRLVRREQPRAIRSHAVSLTITVAFIAVFISALVTRATGSGSAPIGPPDPPVVSTPNRGAGDGVSAGPSAKAASSAPRAASVVLLSTPSPTATMPLLPACRYADQPAAHATYDDWQRMIVDTTSRLPKGYEPPDLLPVARAGLSGGGSIRRIAIADLKALADGRGATRGRVGLPERGPTTEDLRRVGTHLR